MYRKQKEWQKIERWESQEIVDEIKEKVKYDPETEPVLRLESS